MPTLTKGSFSLNQGATLPEFRRNLCQTPYFGGGFGGGAFLDSLHGRLMTLRHLRCQRLGSDYILVLRIQSVQIPDEIEQPGFVLG
jgi:hypothetical protein